MEKIKQQRRCVMAKWIIHSKYEQRAPCFFNISTTKPLFGFGI